ncbi:MAG: AhpC/TSA family protein [Bacteroidota bacterium]|nr:AhpC/TSA family protein [Bacteroidota bacterium]
MNQVFSQSINSDTFTVSGKIVGRDTGVVVLYYTDPEIGNDIVSSTLKNGQFSFTGRVNQICDAHLWTDTSKHNFSDPSVVRFLLEPTSIIIIYNKPNAFIKGSKSQEEKENLDEEKASLLNSKDQLIKEYDSLYHLSKINSTPFVKKEMDELSKKLYSKDEFIKSIDLAYIREHPNSYFSGFLLSSYKRRLPIETLQVYYSLLSANVKSSSEGIKVINYIYPLTTDVDFRNKNPILGLDYNSELNGIKSVYDLSSEDTLGNKVSFRKFEGQYLLIDFWASWCGPCIENFPSWEMLRKKYESDSIQFVSVSLDTRNGDWRKAITKYHLTGIQLSDLKGFEGLLPVYCKVVTGIPRYVLIDKSGKIINYDTPHPMAPELKILIDDLLNKSYRTSTEASK